MQLILNRSGGIMKSVVFKAFKAGVGLWWLLNLPLLFVWLIGVNLGLMSLGVINYPLCGYINEHYKLALGTSAVVSVVINSIVTGVFFGLTVKIYQWIVKDGYSYSRAFLSSFLIWFTFTNIYLFSTSVQYFWVARRFFSINELFAYIVPGEEGMSFFEAISTVLFYSVLFAVIVAVLLKVTHDVLEEERKKREKKENTEQEKQQMVNEE